MKRIPNEKWFMVEPGMNLEEIEAIVGPPNHPSRDLKEMDRWIIDSGLFNSRLTVYYRNPKHPLIASGIEITRYCKLTNSYSIKIKK